jgi:eukaryotic-like serine/threonine-protein kinase
MLGKNLSHYRILEEIGRGGMGVVYRARDEHLDRDVAVKVLPPHTLADEQARRRFRKEAEALSKLNHPNIQTVFDFDTEDGVDFLAGEYVAGEGLDTRLVRGPLPEQEVIRLGQQLAEGLEAAHAEGIVHRDLKPGNLRLTRDGRLKILDFGLARLFTPTNPTAVTESLAEPEAMAGTLPYMAPEQLRGGTLDHRADIWAAGVVLYEMATGRRPFASRPATALIGDIQNRPVTPPRALASALSSRLEEIILKCLEKDPDNRYQSAKELAVDLRRLGLPVAAGPAGRRTRRRVAVALLGVLALLAVLFALAPGNWRERWLGGPARIESLAVLPLENLTGDPGQEYFVDGMTDALIAELSRIAALKVISRTSVMRYKGTRQALPRIARELGVGALVEGSVQRAGDEVGIRVRLVDGRSEKSLWSETYQRDLHDVLGLQSQVALDIASQVRVVLHPEESARVGRRRRIHPEAYEAYLWGRYYAARFHQEDYHRANEFFERAIAFDPDFALPYAALSVVYGGWGRAQRMGSAPGEGFARARRMAEKALELDDSLAEAHLALGVVEFIYGWDWPAAEEQMRRALEIDPNSADAYHEYSHLLSALGRHRESVRAALRALELAPRQPDINAHLSWTYLFSRQFEQAVQQTQRGLRQAPDFQHHHHFLGIALLQLGRYDEALPALERAWELGGHPDELASLGLLHGVAGRPRQAREILARLVALSQQRSVSPFNLALIHLGLGETDRALALLAQAYAERSEYMPYLNVDPRLDALRAQPRFQSLLAQMNFPE